MDNRFGYSCPEITMATPPFIPAARWRPLTPCYDGFVRLFFGRTTRRIATVLNPLPGQKILDVGCGPGNLILELKRRQPAAEITGLDVDPEILQIARNKLEHAGITATLVQASAAAIPLDGPFDAVTSTLMIHHLNADEKLGMLREIYRLLKPGGKLYLYDFAPPQGWFGKFLTGIYRRFEDTEAGITGEYPTMLQQTGFRNPFMPLHTRLFGLLVAEK